MKISNSTPSYINQTYANQTGQAAAKNLKSQQPPAEEALTDNISLSGQQDLQKITKALETEPAGRKEYVAELKLKVDWNAWEIPPVFRLIQETGNISDEEMRMAFNLGVGLIAVVDKNDFDKCKDIASGLGEDAFVIGEIV